MNWRKGATKRALMKRGPGLLQIGLTRKRPCDVRKGLGVSAGFESNDRWWN